MAAARAEVPEFVASQGIAVEFGNDSLHRCVGVSEAETNAHDHEPVDRDAPTVTTLHIPPGYTFDETTNFDGQPGTPSAEQLALHLARNPDITRLPGHEAALVATHPRGGMWNHHGQDVPSWVASDNPSLAALLGDFYGCPVHDMGNDDFHRWREDTHHTIFGPPGVGPATSGLTLPTNLKVNAGNDIQAALLGGGQVDSIGQATASSSTSLTKTGAGWTTDQWKGCRVYATVSATSVVWGFITTNSATVLTVDRWNDPTNPGGAAGSTASSTATFAILGAGGPAAWFMGLTATATAPSATDTSLTGEITTASGGLIRKICPYAHSAGVNSYTLTPVFTGNGNDSYPVTIAQIGVFNTMVVATTASAMLFRTLLNATATLSASGDQLTVTETVTM